MIVDSKEKGKEEQKNGGELGLSGKPGSNSLKEVLQFKVVYWGPGESGKTTNYFRLREKFDASSLRSTV